MELVNLLIPRTNFVSVYSLCRSHFSTMWAHLNTMINSMSTQSFQMLLVFHYSPLAPTASQSLSFIWLYACIVIYIYMQLTLIWPMHTIVISEQGMIDNYQCVVTAPHTSSLGNHLFPLTHIPTKSQNSLFSASKYKTSQMN